VATNGGDGTQKKLSDRLFLFSDDDVKKLEKLAESQPEIQKMMNEKKATAIVMARVAKIAGWLGIIVTVVTLSDEIKAIVIRFFGGGA